MGAVRYAAVPVLLGVLAAAHFALAWQSEKNGTFTLPEVFAFKNRVLPNSDIPIRLPQTGIAPVDNYFAFMMSFFWTALDTRNVRAHLQANYLLGTLSGTWLIMLSEAHRSTTATSFFLLTYFCELMGEFLGIGLFTPLWCVLHLFLTRAPAPTTTIGAEESLSAPRNSMNALGWALVLGHLVPTLRTALTDIDGEGWQSQQLWTILRLFHPVFVFGFFGISKILLSSTSPRGEPPAQRLANKHKIFTFSILASAFGHISTLGVLLAQHWIPNWLREDVLVALDIKTIVFPTPFWLENPVKLVPFVTGVATFLQWDNICSASAILIWAFALYLEASVDRAALNLGNFLNIIFQSISVTLLAGPVAGAAFLLQSRDAIVVAHSSVARKKA